MNIWRVLEIEETTDKNAIKQAYHAKLVHVNPEEDAQGFMELRKAYEDAISLADKPKGGKPDEEEADTPIGRWMACAKELYEDITFRSDEAEWKALLEEDICFQLETKEEVRDAFLVFCMDHVFLPQKIWILFDKAFQLQENKQELYEKFPVQYIDNIVIPGIQYEDYIDYERLTSSGGEEVDEFLSTFFQFKGATEKNENDEAQKLWERLLTFEISHPYLKVSYVRHMINVEKIEEAEQVASELAEEHPGDSEVLRALAEVLWRKEEYEDAYKYYEQALEVKPKFLGALIGAADCLLRMEKHEEAKKKYLEAGKIEKTEYLQRCIEYCNETLIPQYEAIYNEAPEHVENRINLAKSYYQSSRFQEALGILSRKGFEGILELEYEHLVGCCYMYLEQFEAAKEHLLKWKDGILELEKEVQEKETASPEVSKEMERLGVVYQCLAFTYSGTREFEEAIKYADLAIETGMDRLEALEEKARVYFAMKDYENAVNLCDDIIKENQYSFTAHGIRADALFQMDYINDSKQEWDICIQISPYNLACYLKKIECFYVLGDYKEVREVLDYLKEQKVEADQLEYWHILLFAEESKTKADEKEILRRFENLLEKTKKTPDEYVKEYIGDLNYQIARFYWEKTGNKKKSEAYIDKALEACFEHVEANIYKAYFVKERGDIMFAIQYYEHVLREKPNHYNINCLIGEAYEELDDYENALIYHTKQLENRENAYYLINKGLALLELDHQEEARKDFLKAAEYDPDSPHPYNNLGLSYRHSRDFENAEKYLMMALERIENDPSHHAYYNLAGVYARKGEVHKGIDCLARYIKEQGNHRAYYKIGRLYMESGFFEEAIRAFERYIQVLKGEKDYSLGMQIDLNGYLFECYMMQGKERTAVRHLKKMKRLYDTLSYEDRGDYYHTIWELEVRYYLQKKKIDKALHVFMDLLHFEDQLDIESIISRMQLAFEVASAKGINMMELILHQRGAYQNILQEKLEKESGCSSIAHDSCTHANIALLRGAYHEAEEWANAALKGAKCWDCEACECSDAYFLLGICAQLRGDKEGAFQYFEKACKTSPDKYQYYVQYLRLKGELRK